MQPASLDDKYARAATRAYLTGIEALVRLPMLQQQRDRARGLRTAGFISGYRGSPVGTLDVALWKAGKWLDEYDIRFAPAVNEDLAATAVWGTQQAHLLPGANYQGVFAMWYGKGPGVDRSLDAIKHANAFGTTAHGGVLAIAGDDHACKSSTTAHQSEPALIAAAVPVLNPANVQEVLDYGVLGWALSRFCGCWVGMKAITDNMDAAMTAEIDPRRVSIQRVEFASPPGGLNAQWPATPLEQEALLYDHRIDAARAFARANGINRITCDGARAQLGIVTSGKSHLDTLEALGELGLDDARLSMLGVRIYKIGLTWPLDEKSVRAFADGLEEIIVIEEKRDVIEQQLRALLYGAATRIIGKRDEHGAPLIPTAGELTPTIVAHVLAPRLARLARATDALRDAMQQRLQHHADKQQRLAARTSNPIRAPHFCSGCPHNTSTRLPEDAVGLAGIGCHYMAKWMHRNTELFTQMGGEGASWIGIAPFTDTQHAFQNIGDGTYFHSGILAVRAAIASGVNLTYKILYNDAVAMTGGQSVDGKLTLSQLVAQLRGEGVAYLVVVAENPEAARAQLRNKLKLTRKDVAVHARDELARLQQQCREVRGISVIIYDQTCAAEKRRRRKTGAMPQINERIFINAEVCEGCGDCGAASNCLSLLPLPTEFGVKRQIDQSACNADYACLDGFCPSFVSITGAQVRRPTVARGNVDIVLPEPSRFVNAHSINDSNSASAVNLNDSHLTDAQLNPTQPCNILLAGVGGSGVLTVGALIAMAAHLDGKECTTLHQTGLAQKFGAVLSHVRIAARPSSNTASNTSSHNASHGAPHSASNNSYNTAANDSLQDESHRATIHTMRINEGAVDVLLGCDLVVAAMPDSLARIDPSRATAIVNDNETPTAEFVYDADYRLPMQQLRDGVRFESRDAQFLNATRIARELVGDAIAANMVLLGYAWQRGLIPVSRQSIARAIELNGVAIESNQQAFLWGRRAAVNLRAVENLFAAQPHRASADLTAGLDDIIEMRRQRLIDYQNESYAERYMALVNRARQCDALLRGEVDGEVHDKVHDKSNGDSISESSASSESNDCTDNALTVAVAQNYFRLLAYKDEYEVARLYSNGDFRRQLRAQFSGKLKLQFHLAAPLFAKKDRHSGVMKKRRFPQSTLYAFAILAKLKFLRATKLDPFAYGVERKQERQCIRDYEHSIDYLLDELRNNGAHRNYALAVQIADAPKMIRGFGHIKAANIARHNEHHQKLMRSWRRGGLHIVE